MTTEPTDDGPAVASGNADDVSQMRNDGPTTAAAPQAADAPIPKAPPTVDDIPWQSQTPDGQVLLGLPWEIFVLGVAILSIINLFLALVVRNADLDQVISVSDGIYIVIFAADFARRWRVATDPRKYLTKGMGWLDLISIIPLLRIARLLRIVRVIRVVRRMGGPGPAVRAFFADRAAGGLLLVLLIAMVVFEYGSLAVLWAERTSPDANITTAGDSMWYTVVTMSTVGYGDQFPVTEAGRLFGAAIIVVGVGVFGTLTGFLANAFLAPRRDG
jgi:voltage-gated potassium channel